MPRYRTAPLTLAELWSDGPPVRLRDLEAATNLDRRTILRDIRLGELHSRRFGPEPNAPYLIDRKIAQQWLRQLGLRPWVQRSAL